MAVLKICVISAAVMIVAFIVHRQLREPEQPVMPQWKNFGRLSDEDAHAAEKVSPQRFKVSVTDEEMDDYTLRLKRARFPPILSEEVNMTYGYPSHGLHHLRDEMLQFDLKQWAQKLNTYEQYKVSILGLQIHYLKITGNQKIRRIPMLLIHGWPGSVYEFYKVIPLLLEKAEKEGFSYDLIIPSLPGYGFSEPPSKPGCSPRYAAAIFNELMTTLGYDKYISQGGDWGAFVTEYIVTLYPHRVIGFHTNLFTFPPMNEDLRVLPYLLVAKAWPSLVMEGNELLLTEAKGLFSGITFLLQEVGYFHLQSTKPDSVGPALTDSPLGLAAYIIEKFYTWTDGTTVDTPLQQATSSLPYSVSDVLNNIIIYWHSNTIQSSVRFYKETFQDLDHRPFSNTDVPGAILMTRHEMSFCPKFLARLRVNNLVQYTALTKGGHFAAFEIPEEFSADLVSFTKALLLYDYTNI